MLKDRIEKKNLIINSLIDLQEDDGKGKGRYFVSRFIEPGLAHYKELGDIVITKETLDKFIQSMVGCPVIIDHKDVTDKNVDKLRVGIISRVWFNEMDGWYYCEGILTDDEAIDLVKNQGWNVSCSYSFVSDESQKTYHGKPIDMVFTDGEFLHLAIVEDPRYEGANIVVNSNENHEPAGTSKGGQFAKKDTDKNEIVFKNANDNIKKLVQKIIDKFGKPKDLTKISVKKFNEKDIRMGKEGINIDGEIELNDTDDKTILHEFAHSIYRELSEENKNNIEQEHLKYKKEVEDYINKTGDIRLNNFANKVGANAHWRESEEFFCDCFATYNLDNGKNKIAKELIKKLNIEKKENNNSTDKENVIMQVLDELKNFILGIVNNEKEDEMAKVKNEDKRKLIDEIGGILKDKVDDEIIRTVIKKAEELSYEPSEDDKADNKCKNEEEKEEDKEKAENKCKNEDDEKKEEKEEKVEDEEDEDEDVTKNEDEEDKKEVKNSMKDLIMGGAQYKEEKLYISRKERLEEGNKY